MTIYPPLYCAGLASTPVLFWYSVMFNTIGQLSHANIDTACGWLNYVFNTPEVHRYHHSRVPKEANTNYGQVLMVFDVLFGTFYLPSCAQDQGVKGLVPPPSRIGDKGLSNAGVAHNLLRPLHDFASRWHFGGGRR